MSGVAEQTCLNSHNTALTSFRKGCRCERCRRANLVYQRDAARRYRASHTPQVREYQAAYHRLMNRKRRCVLQRYKAMKGCAACGLKGPHFLFGFDHRDPTQKRFDLSDRTSHRSWSSIKAEVKKCNVLCHNCHSIKTEMCGDRMKWRERV